MFPRVNRPVAILQLPLNLLHHHTRRSSSSKKKETKLTDTTNAAIGSSSFKLPVFSPDIKQCIAKDASTQRNRLIKESCIALRGHCREEEIPISNEDKRALAKMLYQKSW